VPIKRVWAPRIDFSVIRRELKLPTDFPPDALREASEAAQDHTDARNRPDRCPVRHDRPATSKDLDQAMHLSRRNGGGYRVQYAIADVAAFVRPGGPLDAETWSRGQTIYLPDGRIPLHPTVLSEGAVSLFPDVDRAARCGPSTWTPTARSPLSASNGRGFVAAPNSTTPACRRPSTPATHRSRSRFCRSSAHCWHDGRRNAAR
jgi:hypothetical protein